MSQLYDCIIIGGGPAGLAIATGLARLLHSAVVLDSGVYRNGRERHVHNVLGFDHQEPAALRKKAKDDILARYTTIDFRNVTVTQVWRTSSGTFEAIDANGQRYSGKKLALAVGVRDVLPRIEGYAECWGRGIFHCLFCHGFENRGAASAGLLAEGVCADPSTALHTARMALQFASRLTVYTNGRPDVAAKMKTAVLDVDARITLETRRIVRLAMGGSGGSKIFIHLEDGMQAVEGFLVSPNTVRLVPSQSHSDTAAQAHAPQVEINGPFTEQLGLRVNSSGEIQASPPFLETNVYGVFAAGDCATTLRAIPQAAAMGGLVAVAIAHQVEENVHRR
jgi:gliotoxin/aspirochlorine biosynthesis thioredoxin reductase